MKKLGFTLAEVLITLVIIGVIAAMTVPTLMNNTNAQEYRSAFKKAISATNQAITLQYALEGLSAQDMSTKEALVNQIFKRRMSVIEGQSTFSNTTQCSSGAVFTTADGVMFCVTTNFAANATGASTQCDTYNEYPCATSTTVPTLMIDVNGIKKPNELTTSSARPRDIYQAMIYAQKVIPFGGAAQEVMYDKGTAGH